MRRKRLPDDGTEHAEPGPLDPALLRDASLLQSFLDSPSSDVVFFKDRESRFTAVSRSIWTYLGLRNGTDMLGKTDFDFFPAEFAARTFAEEQEIIRTGEPVLNQEQVLPVPDGALKWIESSKWPLLDAEGSTIGTFCVSRDTTARKLAEIGLEEQSERLARVVEMQRVVAAAAELDLPSVMQLVCEQTQELTGAPGAAILALEGDRFAHRAASGLSKAMLGLEVPLDGTFSGWVHRHNRAAISHDSHTDERFGSFAQAQGTRSLVIVPLRQGKTAMLLLVSSPEPNAFSEQTVHTLELLSVVLSSALSHAAEFEALARYRTIFEDAPFGIARVSPDGRMEEANHALERVLGYSVEELAAMSFTEYTHPEDVDYNLQLFDDLMDGRRETYQLEKRYIRKDGEVLWAQVTTVLERESAGRPAYAIAMIEDITRRKAVEEALIREAERNEYQALHDSLTGLANRTLFRDRIEHGIYTAQRNEAGLAVLMMDLDRFKEINDSLGHHAGDELLKTLGDRLKRVVRLSDTVARLGGDEFGIILEGCAHESVVKTIHRIRDAVEEPIPLEDLPVSMEASIGVALYPEDGADVDTLLRHADVAMYAAKRGNSTYAFYDKEADAYSPTRLTLVSELRQALDRRELVLYYQPKALLATGEVASVEALLRWEHPVRGLIPPDEFIPAAQETGLIKPLTVYVIEEALRQLGEWEERGVRLSVAVNLSMRSLLDLTFPDQVERMLRRSGLHPTLLEFEITESTMLADPARVKFVLERLSAIGIRLAIDDFGTGYSSLSYLKRLPIDEIKIDRSFVTNMIGDEDDAAIVRSTIELGRNLGLDVVAEGVETREIWDRLGSLGCTIAQGYFLSLPVPADELERWLQVPGRHRDAA